MGIVVLVSALGAQDPPPKTEAELSQQVAGALVGFARSAETYKVGSAARRAYEQVLDHYDPNHTAARAGLGWKRVGDEWQEVDPAAKPPPDAATPAQRKSVQTAWERTQKRVGRLHRDFGSLLHAAGDTARATYHWQRSLVFTPEDRAVHDLLGHGEFDGFRGSAEQIAFVQRMRAILAKARELAELAIEVETLPPTALPAELKQVDFQWSGARGPNCQWWVAGSQLEADECVRWNERAVRMLEFLFGDDPDLRQRLKLQPTRWVAVVRTPAQRDRLLERSPSLRDGETLERAKLFGGGSFKTSSGPAGWQRHDVAHDADSAVGHAAKRGTPWFNSGLSEGFVHAMTWLLCGTVQAWYMQLPATAGEEEQSVRDPAAWLKALRADIEAGADWPLAQVPREQMTNFRNPVRHKAWTFVLWLLARHPDEWVHLMVELGGEKQDVAEVQLTFEAMLHRDFGEVEEEWREWVRAGSRIGRASGLPQ